MEDVSDNPDSSKSRPLRRFSLLLKIGLLTAIVLHILMFFLFRVHSTDLPNPEPSKPYITFVSEESFSKDAELEEYALLFDSAPLFIPTRWNASQSVEVDFEYTSLGTFSEFEPKIEVLSELKPDGILISDNYDVNTPSDLIASRFWRFFEGFGQSFEALPAPEQPAPVAEVYVVGESINPALSLEVDLEPTVSASVPRSVSYTIRRSEEGLIWGTPTLVETSGNEALDQSVARWLKRPDVLAQLPIGYLSIRVFFW
jgi:hypothetical protein